MVSIFHFLETDIREKQYEMRTQTSLNNAVNDLHYEIKFEIIMRIHIITNKYTVKKYEKLKMNKKILTYIKQSQYKNITFINILEN